MTGPSQNIPPLVATAEERMRALLAQEKWRQARDELKPLVKVDRVRFLPLLVQANLGLARKMLAGGQAAEARQVVNYLATLVSAEQLRAIELELTVKTGAPEQSISKFVAALTEARDALSEAECVRLADWVVLSFQTVEMGQSPPPARERLAAEVRAVHEALRAVAAARWPEVSELLRLVPHRSVVSHWAVFIKGLAAFHTGGTDKATKLLRSLPAASVPGKAAQAYLLLAAEPTAAPRNSAAAGSCAGGGLPAGRRAGRSRYFVARGPALAGGRPRRVVSGAERGGPGVSIPRARLGGCAHRILLQSSARPGGKALGAVSPFL
jgi:hypothetical protein